jgi:hypothetical protein
MNDILCSPVIIDKGEIYKYNNPIGAWRRWLAHQLGVLGVVRSNRIAPISLLIFPGIAI